MKCHYHRCDHDLNGPGSRLREISSRKILAFCSPLCRSLFMRAAADATEYRATHQQDQIGEVHGDDGGPFGPLVEIAPQSDAASLDASNMTLEEWLEHYHLAQHGGLVPR